MSAPTSRQKALGIGCLVLFGLPFAGFGIFAFVQAVNFLGSNRRAEAIPLLLFGLVFSIVGLGIMAAGFIGGRMAKRTSALERAHPDEPWKWRSDWAEGKVISSHWGTVLLPVFFAVVWNGISWTVTLAASREFARKPEAMFVLLFPLVGLFLIGWAGRAVLRWMRFGRSTLELDSLPAVPGGELSGVIRTQHTLLEAREVHVRLACVERVQQGKNTRESLEWEDAQSMRGQVIPAFGGIPVSFRLPADVPGTGSTGERRQIIWRLEAGVDVPGTDYSTKFEVPVFRAPAPLVNQSREKQIAPYLLGPEERRPAGIRVEPANGGTEFVFAAGRNLGAAIPMTIFTIIWTAVVVLLFHFKAPMVFRIIFGFIGALMWLGTISSWTAASHVFVDSSGLRLTKWWGFMRRMRNIPASDVVKLEQKFSMSHNSTTYYDVSAVLPSGRKVKLAASIRGKRDAEWILREMQKALGHATPVEVHDEQ